MPSLFTLVVLAFGAALRLWFIHLHPMVQGDSLLYGDIAANWINHGIYGHSVGHDSGLTTVEPTLVRLPGYPAFLAFIFALFGTANYRAVVYVQALVDLGACLLIAHLARKQAARLPPASRSCWQPFVRLRQITSLSPSPKPSRFSV